jgi:ParB family chromosome partitioning protein
VSDAGVAKRGLPLRVKMRHGAHFVDELSRRHDTPVGKMLPLSSIQPNADQPRTDIGDLADLISSVRDKGVLEPILVRAIRSREGDEGDAGLGAEIAAGAPARAFEIVAGERRYRAALAAGLFEIPAIELDVTPEEALEITLIENLQRKDLNPFEEAEGFRALAQLHGYTQEQIAKATGRSRSLVAESLTLLAVPKELRERALALGVSSKSALLEVAKIGDPKLMAGLLEKAARQGLNRDDLRKETRGTGGGKSGAGRSTRSKPYTFRFRSPDKSFNLQLNFRQSTVDRDDLIRALEAILNEIRSSGD